MRDINGEDGKTGRKLKEGQEELREQTAFQKQAFVLLWTGKYSWQKCSLKWEVTGAGKAKLTDLRQKMECVFRGSKVKQGKWRFITT